MVTAVQAYVKGSKAAKAISTISVDPMVYGAKADVWCFTYGSFVAGALNVLVLPNTLYKPSAATPGNPIVIRGVGAGGADLITTIVAANGPNITLAAPAAQAYAVTAGINGYFGTDDAPAINAAIVANSRQNGPWSVNAVQPTWPGTTNSYGEWIHGPTEIVLKSNIGVNNSLYGISSPIRLSTGTMLSFETSVIALPNFTGSSMLHQQIDTNGNPVSIAMSRVKNARLLCEGFAAYGIWMQYTTSCEFHGGVNIFQAATTGILIGDASGSYGTSLCSFNGRLFITGVSNNSATAGNPRDNSGTTGMMYVGNTADNTVNGDVWCEGFRTGYYDNGGSNNKVHGTLHCWTNRYYGQMYTAARLGGGGYVVDRILSDTASAPANTSAYGVILERGTGYIGSVCTVWNYSSSDVYSNQYTVVQNNYAGAGQISIGAVQAFTGNTSNKIANIIAGSTSTLDIASISSDGNYSTLGYVLEKSARSTADAALQTQITSINSVLPGQPWTPTQLTKTQMPFWIDASDTTTMSMNANNMVTSLTSKVGTAIGSIPTSYVGPTWSNTAFMGSKPGLVFNGATYGSTLDFGASNTIFQNSNDFLAFMVVTRGVQNTANSAHRNYMFYLTGGLGSSNTAQQFSSAFEAPASDAANTIWLAIGNGTTGASAFGVANTSAIVEAYSTANYPPTSYTAGTAINGYVAQSFKTKANGGYSGGTYATGNYSSNFTVGNVPTSTDGTYNGAFTLAEMLIIQGSSVGDTNLIAEIEGYLSKKWWGLTTSSVLTTSHVYYSAGPSNAPFVTSAAVTGFVQTASTTVANTANATSVVSTGVGTLTIPAGTLTVGKNYRIKLAGSVSTGATPGNLTISMTMGANTIGSSVLQALPASATSVGWNGEIDVVCRSIGNTGTVIASGVVSHDSGTGRGGASFNPTGATAIVNSAAAATFGVTATWATASANNSLVTTLVELVAMN